jgi:hypothetical protein
MSGEAELWQLTDAMVIEMLLEASSSFELEYPKRPQAILRQKHSIRVIR